MRTIDIDPTFRPFPECQQIPVYRIDYPSGCEPHIRVGPAENDGDDVLITLRPRDMNDLFRAMAASDALMRISGTTVLPGLFIPYLPHARQDRVAVPGDAFSLQVVVGMLNNHFSHIHVFDPHNEQETCKCAPLSILPISAASFIQGVMDMEGRDASGIALVFPDEGSALRFPRNMVAKYSLMRDGCYREYDRLHFRKKRNPENGTLEFLPPEIPIDVHGLTCIIVDDICDGGGTFIPVADHLRKLGAKKIVLAVSHGIFSKGTMELMKHIDHVHCTNSFNDINGGFITQHTDWSRLLGGSINDLP